MLYTAYRKIRRARALASQGGIITVDDDRLTYPAIRKGVSQRKLCNFRSLEPLIRRGRQHPDRNAQRRPGDQNRRRLLRQFRPAQGVRRTHPEVGRQGAAMDILRPIDYVCIGGRIASPAGKRPGRRRVVPHVGLVSRCHAPLEEFRPSTGYRSDSRAHPLLGTCRRSFRLLPVAVHATTPRIVLARFRDKHPDRSLLCVWIGMVAIACVETLLMLHLGIWRVGMER